MKKIFATAFLMFSLTALAGEVEVKVNGMVCSMCAQGIQKKFKSEPGVKSLNVDLDKKVVHIQTHEGQDVSDEVITKLITESGYNVAQINRK